MSSYNISEPSAIKRLKSDGKVVDDNGNVINEGDYWQKVYNESEPKVDKILKSDGSVTDSEGNVIQSSTEFNVKKYTQAEPIPAKYLHSDGTIDENPGSGGGGSNLQNNKQVNIITNGETVVNPDDGYDGLKKVTVNVNVSGGGSSTLYAWKFGDDVFIYRNLDKSPSTNAEFQNSLILDCSSGFPQKRDQGNYSIEMLLERVSDDEFTTQVRESYYETYTRSPENDIVIW